MRTRILSLAMLGSALAVAFGGAFLAAPAQASAPSSPNYYVSLGDSYSVGYQPDHGATVGYTGFVAAKTHLKLVNFGCGGATTTSILQTVGCPDVLPHTAGIRTYPTTTQIAAADAFIAANKGHIGLITVSIGGNDVTTCATVTNPTSCVANAVKGIDTNVTTLAADLRRTAGPNVKIIGTTYPDVILGSYVYPHRPPAAATVTLAKLSVVAFKSLINPALSKSYASAKASFVDVTAASGGYMSLNKKVKTKAYGTIPAPVARVCKLTWFCAQGNIHATTKGYHLIGRLIVHDYTGHKKKA